MKRRDVLKAAGLAGIAAVVVPVVNAKSVLHGSSPAMSGGTQGDGGCTLIPTETAGPFPLDLTSNSFYFRQDVREEQEGVQLNLRMKIIGADNCENMPNLRVNIWHCSAEGLYSGYSGANNPGQAGLTYLRGYQITDANGEVEFITIFPGWYPGRVCHIHFQVYVNSVYAAISQLTFPIETKNAIYAANSSVYTDGADPLAIEDDGIFSDGYSYQLSSLTPNETTGGYDAYLEVTIQGEGTTGIPKLEPETGGQFVLGQNFPNPYMGETAIPLTLKNASRVRMEFWDVAGKKVATIDKGTLSTGNHTIEVNVKSMGLESANYLYQVEVENTAGIYRQCKMMTVGK